MIKTKKYNLPDFLKEIINQNDYEKWLKAKAHTHIKRDRKKGNIISSNKEYKIAIHNAVIESGGFDRYTGEKLDWSIINKYNNLESKKFTRAYKKKFALLPSVDHVGDGLGSANFKICSWRTNDSKNDLSYDEFLKLCDSVIKFAKMNKT
jgi:hypothetical protein